jgi:beta-mannanase
MTQSSRNAIAPVMLVAALALLIAVRVVLGATSAPPAPWPLTPPVVDTFQLGVATDPLARNSFRRWHPDDLRSVNAFEQSAHRHADIVMFYADWEHAAFSRAQLDAIAARHSIPEITWEPWDASRGLRTPQPRYRLINIINGRFDDRIRSWANGLADYGKPVRLRFAQEMNGFWYPWSERGNGNQRGEFVRAWRHVHEIFTATGADNVEWVWSPVFGAPPSYFPGEGYVDRLGLTCLNAGPGLFAGGWRTIDRICGRSVADLHALAPALPIEISELGSSEHGGDKAAWIANAVTFLRAHPEVQSAVWFNLHKETDWRIQSSPSSKRAAAAAFGTAARPGPPIVSGPARTATSSFSLGHR